jgi:hypothetical protein
MARRSGGWRDSERALRRRHSDEIIDQFDVRAESGSDLNRGENQRQLEEKIYDPDFNIEGSIRDRPSRKQQRQQQRQQYVSDVQEQTGHEYESELGGEPKIRVLPKLIQRKGMDIRIDAAILTDSEAILNAIAGSLDAVSTYMTQDVSTNRGEVFADTSGHNTFKAYGGDSAAYYGSGKVPFWKGNLIRAFRMERRQHRCEFELGFNAVDYASAIENGGVSSSPPPPEWVAEKMEGQGKIFASEMRVAAHPFTGSVAFKLSQKLGEYGYLDVFGIVFSSQFR